MKMIKTTYPTPYHVFSYSEYWRSRLASEPITNFAPVVKTNTLSTGKYVHRYMYAACREFKVHV